MLKTLIILAHLALLTSALQAEDTTSPETEWGSQNLELDSLKTWGTRHYSFSAREPGRKSASLSGSMTLATEVTPHALILRDNFQITYKGEKLSLKMVYTCKKDNFLSPKRIESKGEGSDEFGTFEATITSGTATIISEHMRKKSRKIPHGTITTAAMLRLVTLVPRTPGLAFSYQYSLEAEELNLKEKYRLLVLQPETITSGNQQVKCSKFKLTGGGIHPVYYWVTEDSVLQRVLIDDRKVMELTEKAEPLKHTELKISDQEKRQIEKAIQSLGATEHQARADATTTLLRFGPKAIPALVNALSSKDPETKLRAKEALATIREKVTHYDEGEDIPQLKPANRVSARHILFAVKGNNAGTHKQKLAEAELIRKKLIAGADFSKMAQQHSDCPSRAKGGDLGMFRKGMMVKPFENAAFTQPVNTIGPIVTTQFGYHLILVTTREE